MYFVTKMNMVMTVVLLLVIAAGFVIKKKGFKQGLKINGICFIVLFAVFLGDHYYNKFQFWRLCSNEAVYKVYDEAAYRKSRMPLENPKENLVELNEKETYDKLLFTGEKRKLLGRGSTWNKKANRLYYAVQYDKENTRETSFYLYDLENNHLIFEKKNIYISAKGGGRGWFVRWLFSEDESGNLGSCEKNRYGPYWNK